MENGKSHGPEEGFTYSYSAPTEEERREIVAIRSQYAARSESDRALERVKLLDKKVRRLPLWLCGLQAAAGVLIFGGGMALCLEVAAVAAIAGGIALSIAGAALCGLAHLTKKCARRRLKEKYGDEILRLTEQLLGGEGGGNGAK